MVFWSCFWAKWANSVKSMKVYCKLWFWKSQQSKKHVHNRLTLVVCLLSIDFWNAQRWFVFFSWWLKKVSDLIQVVINCLQLRSEKCSKVLTYFSHPLYLQWLLCLKKLTEIIVTTCSRIIAVLAYRIMFYWVIKIGPKAKRLSWHFWNRKKLHSSFSLKKTKK